MYKKDMCIYKMSKYFNMSYWINNWSEIKSTSCPTCHFLDVPTAYFSKNLNSFTFKVFF